MDSREFNGPLTVFSNGRVVRAWLSRATVWNWDDLHTHSEDRDIIGEKIDPFDCLTHNCDDLKHVELSLPNSKTTDRKMQRHNQVHHPSSPGTMSSVVGNDGTTESIWPKESDSMDYDDDGDDGDEAMGSTLLHCSGGTGSSLMLKKLYLSTLLLPKLILKKMG
ncbi:hypothetical protein F5146DRAFT_998124 [Armillaria mellea]|nr:hypothetical protein F5146DRAFT_998124 [Armillaria mellea]